MGTPRVHFYVHFQSTKEIRVYCGADLRFHYRPQLYHIRQCIFYDAFPHRQYYISAGILLFIARSHLLYSNGIDGKSIRLHIQGQSLAEPAYAYGCILSHTYYRNFVLNLNLRSLEDGSHNWGIFANDDANSSYLHSSSL